MSLPEDRNPPVGTALSLPEEKNLTVVSLPEDLNLPVVSIPRINPPVGFIFCAVILR